jgi:hypothetical protein
MIIASKLRTAKTRNDHLGDFRAERRIESGRFLRRGGACTRHCADKYSQYHT